MANYINFTRGGAYNYDCSHTGLAPDYRQAPPNHVGAEYARGSFVVGNAFNPSRQLWQKESLQATKAKVGDFIGVSIIPQEHAIYDVMVRVIPEQTRPDFAMNIERGGFVFDVKIKKYDTRTQEYLGDIEPKTALSGITLDDYVFKRSSVKPEENGYLLETGTYAIIGLEIKGLPDDEEQTLHELTSIIYVGGHVTDWDIPSN